MGRDNLYGAVPSFFRCPISLEVMKSPVSLCTGMSNDRSTIQRWLGCGNNTCPATMQVLSTKDFVPNHTLQRLIQIWSDSVRGRRSDPNTTNPPHFPPSVTQDQAGDLITKIHNNHNQNRNCSEPISKIVSFAKKSDQNRKFLATINNFVAPPHSNWTYTLWDGFGGGPSSAASSPALTAEESRTTSSPTC